MIYLNTALQSFFSLFESKETKEFNKKVAEVEALAQKALGNSSVRLTVSQHMLTLDLGYRGPITSWYLDQHVKKILGSISATKKGYQFIISKKDIAALHKSFDTYITKPRLNNQEYLGDINRDCGQDLTENCPDVMNKYIHWESKPEGWQPGIVATKQNNKSTIIKRCSVIEGLDFALFSLAKECDIAVPKVKMRNSGNHYYLFSKHLGKDTYRDFADYLHDPSCYVDFDTLTVHLGRKEDGTFTEAISIERLSVARIMVACAVFGLNDIHGQNIGLNLQNKGGIKLFQLAMCDCDITPCQPNQTKIEKKDYPTIGACIRENVLKFSWESHHPLLKLLLNAISDDEFQVAFDGFKVRFPSAQQRLKPQADPIVKSLLRQQKSLSDLPLLEETWVRWNHNFGILSRI